METSNLSVFVEKLRTDESLMRRVVEIEKASADKIFRQIDQVNREQNDAVLKLAKEAGLDLSEELHRPGARASTPAAGDFEDRSCTFTCCFVFTSTFKRQVTY